MMRIDAKGLHFSEQNRAVRDSADSSVRIDNCCGHRYIASGDSGKTITINGVPGNALGAYLDGSTIEVMGNAQDAVGDTMNRGRIVIHGNCGDAPGYGMRGGKILIKGNVGYRAGIHMKAYQDAQPVIIAGGVAGSFLGEYQAGGKIIVLNLYPSERPIVGFFCGTGMHGGRMYLRCEKLPGNLPSQVSAAVATAGDIDGVRGDIEDFCKEFGGDVEEICASRFYVLSPNTSNPYKQMFTHA